MLLAFGTDLGLTIWTTRALARDPAAGPGILGTGLRLRLGATAVVLLAFAGVAVAVGQPEVRWAVLALGGAALARAFLDHARAVFRAHETARRRGEGQRGRRAREHGRAGWARSRRRGGAPGGAGIVALAVGILVGTLAGAVYGFSLLGRR